MKKVFGALFAVIATPFLLYLLVVAGRFVFYGIMVDNSFRPLLAAVVGGMSALISACCIGDWKRGL